MGRRELGLVQFSCIQVSGGGIAKWNGFVIEGERGQDEIVYPKIKFDDLQLRDDTGKLQMLVTANQNGVISNVSLIEAFGLDSDQEIERLKQEELQRQEEELQRQKEEEEKEEEEKQINTSSITSLLR